MTLGIWTSLRLYLTAVGTLFLQASIGALAIFWGLQLLAFICDVTFDQEPVLVHLFLSLCFLGLFPGQKVWTVQVEGPDGEMHTIIGGEPETN